jgi:hypothetical protein
MLGESEVDLRARHMEFFFSPRIHFSRSTPETAASMKTRSLKDSLEETSATVKVSPLEEASATVTIPTLEESAATAGIRSLKEDDSPTTRISVCSLALDYPEHLDEDLDNQDDLDCPEDLDYPEDEEPPVRR